MNAKSSIPDYQHKTNQQKREALEKEGFSFEITSSGYFVRHHGTGLGGASTGKPCHGRYREANMRDNLAAAIQKAESHRERAARALTES